MSSTDLNQNDRTDGMISMIRQHKKKLILILSLVIASVLFGLNVVRESAKNDMATCTLTSAVCGSVPGHCNYGYKGGARTCLYNGSYGGHSKCDPCS